MFMVIAWKLPLDSVDMIVLRISLIRLMKWPWWSRKLATFDSDKVSISWTNVNGDWRGWIVQSTVGWTFVNDHCDTSVYVAVVVISDARLHPSSVKNVGLELTYHIHNKPC